MIIGNYTQKISSKGRTAFPSKFRAQLPDTLVLLQGYEQCLMIVPADSLSQLSQADKPFALTAAREIDRFLLGNAFEIETDAQGRFVVPAPLRDYAQLDQAEVIFVGVGNRVELWNPTKWQEYQTYLSQNSSKIAEKLVQFESK